MKEVNNLIEEEFQKSEKFYREQIFSPGNSSIVPIYLINENSNISKNLTLILDETKTPYIESGISFPEKYIEQMKEWPLYFHNKTNKHFFLSAEIEDNLLHEIKNNCKVVSSAEIAITSPNEIGENWGKIEKKLEKTIKKYSFLKENKLEDVMGTIKGSVEKLSPDPRILNYFSTFTKLGKNDDWKKEYDNNLSSLLLGLNISKNNFPQIDLDVLSMVFLLKDIGYSRLIKKIENYQILHPLVSYKIINELNSQNINESKKLPFDVLDSVLKHHEFTDGSGLLSSRGYWKNEELEIPLYAQISGLSELFINYYNYFEDIDVGYAHLIGFISPIANIKGKYSNEVIGAFNNFYYQIREAEKTDNSSNIDENYKKMSYSIQENLKSSPENHIRLENIISVENSSKDKIIKTIGGLRVMGENGILLANTILKNQIPRIEEFNLIR